MIREHTKFKMSSSSSSVAAAAASPYEFLYQIRRAHTQQRFDLKQKQKEELRELKEKHWEEVSDLSARQVEEVRAFFAKIDARRAAAVAEAQVAASAQKIREELVAKLKEAQAAAEAAGVKISLAIEMPAPPPTVRSSPKQPLTEWQSYMKKTGELLSKNGVELHPGSKDVRVLAVFCSIMRASLWNITDWKSWGTRRALTDDEILGLARSWHAAGGRAELENAEKQRVWFRAVVKD